MNLCGFLLFGVLGVFTSRVVSQVNCLEKEGQRSCLVKRACFTNTDEGFYFTSTPTDGDVQASVHGPKFLQRNILLRPKYTHQVFADSHEVHCVLKPFYMPNIGHALGDDIFPIFRALHLFGLHNAPVLRILSLQAVSDFPARVREMYDAIRMNVTTLENACYDNLVLGISGLSYHESFNFGGGDILDTFRDFVFKRAGIRHGKLQSPRFRPPTFTIIGKDFSVADHPQGIANPEFIQTVVQQRFPQSKVRHLKWSEVAFAEQLKVLSETDIHISAPGSDLMSAVFLPNHRVLLVVPLCSPPVGETCFSNLGNELSLWFRHRATLHIVAYDPIYSNEIVAVHVQAHNQTYYKVHVNETTLSISLERANNTFRAWRALPLA